jgi:hypothetical protein
LDQASQQGDPSDFRMTEKIAEFYGKINNQGGFLWVFLVHWQLVRVHYALTNNEWM